VVDVWGIKKTVTKGSTGIGLRTNQGRVNVNRRQLQRRASSQQEYGEKSVLTTALAQRLREWDALQGYKAA
jgi:hypothetical protein